MKRSLTIACLVVGIALAPGLSYASDDADLARDQPKAFVKDSAITAKIKSKLAAEHLVSLGRIHVDTDASGIVWLSGNVKSQDELDKTVSIARGTEGVVAVKNHLEVKKDD